MNVSIVSIVKNSHTTLVEVTIRYPGALDTVKLVFITLPSELGVEFYRTASKETLDSMRGLKESASRNKSDTRK